MGGEGRGEERRGGLLGSVVASLLVLGGDRRCKNRRDGKKMGGGMASLLWARKTQKIPLLRGEWSEEWGVGTEGVGRRGESFLIASHPFFSLNEAERPSHTPVRIRLRQKSIALCS